MTRPLRSTSITPASSLLRGSPPLSGASVLSASRLEPLAPCMGFRQAGFRTISFSCFLHRFLCSTWKSPFLRPDPAVLQSRRAQEAVKVGRRTNLSTYSGPCQASLDSSQHGGTLDTVGMTIRGEPAFGRADQSRHNLVFGESNDPNHDAAMRIGSEAPRRRTPFFSSAQKP